MVLEWKKFQNLITNTSQDFNPPSAPLSRLWNFCFVSCSDLSLGRVMTQPQRPAAYSLFKCLPAELIQEIADWLTPSSIASLSLCNHRLHIILGKRSLQDLHRSDSNEQALLLQALDRDLPETLYCFICNRLHVLFRGREDGLRAEEMYRRVSDGRCPSSDGTYNYGTAYTYHAGFKFEHVQMAMKLHRRGLLSDAKAYLTGLAFLEPARGRMTSLPTNSGLYFFEPRFVNDQISVRAQSWILIQGEQGSVVPRRHYTTVCAHLDGNSFNENPYIVSCRCKLKHLTAKQDSCERCRSLIRCHYCPTEVCVEAKRFDKGSNGGVLIITKWQLLGCGLSPSEAHWRLHLEDPSFPSSYLPDCALGSIRAGYEDQPGIKHDSLLKMTKAWKMLTKG